MFEVQLPGGVGTGDDQLLARDPRLATRHHAMTAGVRGIRGQRRPARANRRRGNPAQQDRVVRQAEVRPPGAEIVLQAQMGVGDHDLAIRSGAWRLALRQDGGLWCSQPDCPGRRDACRTTDHGTTSGFPGARRCDQSDHAHRRCEDPHDALIIVWTKLAGRQTRERKLDA